MDKKIKIGLAVGATLAFCGIGFGAYQMGQSDVESGENSSIIGSFGETTGLFDGASGGSGGSGGSGSGGFGSDYDLSAEEMRLQDFFGTVALSNSGESKVAVAGSRLVSLDNVATEVESNAFLLLDSSKIVRVNEVSTVEVRQEEEHYDVELLEGTLFFNVSESLAPEESLEFYTNNMVTGVRGTSGIITYDRESYQSTILLLTGTVELTTRGEFNDNYTLNQGDMAICTTQYDGTVEVVIVSQEEKGNFYFSDGFIDNIQGDLSGEGDSYSLSENLRKPDMVMLSENIRVLGMARNMSYEQAYGFAEVIRNWENPVTGVSFVDGGDGVPMMIIKEDYTYRNYSALQDYTVDMPHFFQWNGSYAEDVLPPEYSSYYMGTVYLRDGVYTLRYGPTSWGQSGVETYTFFHYYLENGQRLENPYAVFVDTWLYSSSYDSSASDMNWDIANKVTTTSDWRAHKAIYGAGSNGDMFFSIFYDGAWQYLGSGFSVDVSGYVGTREEDIPWNDTDTVLAELGG